VADQWNHNIHYHPVVMAAVPSRCDSALDVGCGTGLLTRKLSAVVPHVTGVDRDEQSITIARSLAGPASGIEYLHGDFRHLPLQDGSFGLVTAVASLHHMDAAAALTRMRDLLHPGGVLVVIGLGRDGWSPRDLAVEIPALVINRVQLFRHRPSRRNGEAGTDYKPPVVWPPAETYQQIRALANRLLPGVRYRRHLYWRYSICWRKPA
jgi:ubiquinone/menaquinone biosynthesis C-methylase UbiE